MWSIKFAYHLGYERILDDKNILKFGEMLDEF